MTLEKETLFNMHEFYSNEARHQRSMMWETVKWFTPILTLILGVLGKYLIEYQNNMNLKIAFLLSLISVFGIALCIVARGLLSMFYKTNLKYVTMFIKVEGELNIDQSNRSDTRFFSQDSNITYKNYSDNRNLNSSEQFVDEVINRKRPNFLTRMNSVFSLLAFSFAVGAIFIWYFYFSRCI